MIIANKFNKHLFGHYALVLFYMNDIAKDEIPFNCFSGWQEYITIYCLLICERLQEIDLFQIFYL